MGEPLTSRRHSGYISPRPSIGLPRPSNTLPSISGDIITMGVDEPANHTVVILDTITDESGNVVDYLLCSNTADLRNFPASAYYYTNRQLIRIIGWND